MSNNNLSFAVALNMITDNFKSGVNQVKSGLNTIKSTALQVASVFGMGLGIKATINKMIDVAKETGRVNKELKFASKSVSDFAKNQEYLLQISNKYKVNLNVITDSFSKYTQSANDAGVSMKDQKTLFEGLVGVQKKSAMSNENFNTMLDGMGKMFVKNTIQIKPLISTFSSAPQLIGIMAQSMGLSIEEMKKMAKQGKLLSSDVFPKFGLALKNSFSNVDTNNASSAFNQIENSWIKLTKNLGVKSIYDKIAVGFANAFSKVVDNLDTVSNLFINIIATSFIGKGINIIISSYAKLKVEAEKSYISQAIAAKKAALEQELASSTKTKKEIAAYNKTELKATATYAKQTYDAEKYSLLASFSFKKMGVALKSAFNTVAPLLLISMFVELIQNAVEFNSKQKEIKNSWNDYQNELKKTTNTEEITKMKALLEVMNSKKNNQKQINNAQLELENMLGVEKKSQKEINELVGKRIKLLINAAKADFYSRKSIEAENRKSELLTQMGGASGMKKISGYVKGTPEFAMKMGVNGKYQNWLTEYIQQDKIQKNSDLELKKYIGYASVNQNYDVGDTNNNDKHKESELEKTIKEYNENSKKLYNQKLAGSIKEIDFAKQIDELNKKTYEEIGGLLGKNASKNKTFIKAKSGVDNLQYTPAIQEQEFRNNYKIDKQVIDNNNAVGMYKNDDYNNALLELNKSYIESISKIKGVNVAESELIKDLKNYSKSLEKKIDYSLPEKQKIDHTFDYKKTDEDKTIDKANRNDDYIDKLKDKLEKVGDEKGVDNVLQKIKDAKGDYNELLKELGSGAEYLIEELDSALINQIDLEKSLKIIELKSDIKELKNNLLSGVYSTTKNLVSATSDIYNCWKNINNTLKNGTGFEKFLAIFDGLTSGIDKIVELNKQIQQLVKLFTSLKGAQKSLDNINKGTNLSTKSKKGTFEVGNLMSLDDFNKPTKKDKNSSKIKDSIKEIEDLNKAKKTQQVIDTATTANQLTNDQLSSASNITSALTNKSTATTNILVNSAETQSNAAKSASALPFPANLIAIAGSIATVVALMNSIPKFENGGIVGGNNFTGDKILTRINSGEMILNKGQQNTIFGLLNNNQTTTSNAEVTFKIEGKTLKGVLDNYNKIKGK